MRLTACLCWRRSSAPTERVANYCIQHLDINRCQILFRHGFGNPDLLVELGHSKKGGWWITGSIEQTLLHSNDGRHWRKTALPAGLSSLVSAYVANPREIWPAAIVPDDAIESPYLLVYSGDGGRSWRNVIVNDAILRRLPRGWLEGQKRRGHRPSDAPTPTTLPCQKNDTLPRLARFDKHARRADHTIRCTRRGA